MTTTSLYTSFTTLLGLLAARYVNTGDRMLDNTINTFLMSILVTVVALYSEPYYYNMFIYYVVDRPKSHIPGENYALYMHVDPLSDKTTKLVSIDISISKECRSALEKKYPHLVDYTSSTCLIYHLGKKGRFVYIICETLAVKVLTHDKQLVRIVRERLEADIEAYKKENNETVGSEKKAAPRRIMTYDGTKTSKIGTISIRKTFDRIYYDQKKQVLTLLDKFKVGALYPENISMDNKLGILLYGPPGTGKTGTISAIANYIGRDVMSINFSEITTCSQLDTILQDENHKYYIYVFDEFDCLLDVLVNGKGAESEVEPTTDWVAMLAVAEKEERSKILEMMKDSTKKKKSDKITLAYLLQKLDGMDDASGRLIIATTNHPEHINPALLRPGRFDLKLCLSNCSAQMYVDILTNYFNDENAAASIAAAALTPGRWSPLQVINTAVVEQTLSSTLRVLSA